MHFIPEYFSKSSVPKVDVPRVADSNVRCHIKTGLLNGKSNGSSVAHFAHTIIDLALVGMM